jgi:hypothetical protein
VSNLAENISKKITVTANVISNIVIAWQKDKLTLSAFGISILVVDRKAK